MSDQEIVRRAANLATHLASEFAEYSSPSHVGATPEPELDLPPASDLLAEYDRRITDAELRLATRSRFVSTHYADAVESAVKALNECIRGLTGSSLDGDKLMTDVFSVQSPKLRLPERLTSDNQKSEQRGHMMLCQGVVAAWRNPRAHKLYDDSPELTLMMVEMVQHLVEASRAATRTRRKRSA